MRDPECACCGDPAEKIHEGRPLCMECWDELINGVISTEPAHPYGTGGCYGPLEDTGPWQDNAIRDLEG